MLVGGWGAVQLPSFLGLAPGRCELSGVASFWGLHHWPLLIRHERDLLFFLLLFFSVFFLLGVSGLSQCFPPLYFPTMPSSPLPCLLFFPLRRYLRGYAVHEQQIIDWDR